MGRYRAMSADELREHIRVLKEFEHDYRRYLAQQGAPDPYGGTADLRATLVRRVARAKRAMNASGVKLELRPPPLLGGPILTDFASQVFAHERPPYISQRYGELPDAAAMVLDAIATAEGALEDDLENVERSLSAATAGDSIEPGASKPRPGRRGWKRLTLFGRIHAVPAALGVVADLISVGLAAAGLLKLAGILYGSSTRAGPVLARTGPMGSTATTRLLGSSRTGRGSRLRARR
jgi:hypothetical protein